MANFYTMSELIAKRPQAETDYLMRLIEARKQQVQEEVEIFGEPLPVIVNGQRIC